VISFITSRAGTALATVCTPNLWICNSENQGVFFLHYCPGRGLACECHGWWRSWALAPALIQPLIRGSRRQVCLPGTRALLVLEDQVRPCLSQGMILPHSSAPPHQNNQFFYDQLFHVIEQTITYIFDRSSCIQCCEFTSSSPSTPGQLQGAQGLKRWCTI
jgi:hypothetical protein